MEPPEPGSQAWTWTSVQEGGWSPQLWQMTKLLLFNELGSGAVAAPTLLRRRGPWLSMWTRASEALLQAGAQSHRSRGAQAARGVALGSGASCRGLGRARPSSHRAAPAAGSSVSLELSRVQLFFFFFSVDFTSCF